AIRVGAVPHHLSELGGKKPAVWSRECGRGEHGRSDFENQQRQAGLRLRLAWRRGWQGEGGQYRKREPVPDTPPGPTGLYQFVMTRTGLPSMKPRMSSTTPAK